MSIEGRVVAITGGASGTGLATAKLLASRGARVSIADVRQQSDIDKAAAIIRASASHDEHVLMTACDVRDVAQVGEWLKATASKFGRLDHVANVAGVWRSAKIEEQSEEMWEFVIGVNLTGAMHVLRESSKLMSNDAGCSMVIVSSSTGLHGLPGFSAYSASKHGVIGLARCLAKELGPRGIRVNCVAPGAIDTPMQHKVNGGAGTDIVNAFAKTLPMGRQGEAGEVAKLIAFLLGDEGSYVTGSVYTIDGGHMC